MVSVFWSVYAGDLDDIRRAGIDALHAAIRRLDPDALLRPSDDLAHWGFAEYVDVVMPRWHAPGWAVLGDAAHAMSPQLGQGVNLALIDAWTLARCIEARDDLPTALASYTQLRRSQLGFYQRATRWLTPFFQSSIPGAATLRNLVLPAMGHVPPLERQMLRSMAGLKRGLLRRSYPSEPETPE
jgi:2-polyprenyl-6-methoxyphenol hydroxylase-like FAD-dependent oxidoreductase